jgi:hypothetical protein
MTVLYDNSISSKSGVYQYLGFYVQRQTNIAVSKIEKIEEQPQTVRHACLKNGVCFLPLNQIQLNIRDRALYLTYYFCTACVNCLW